ncbi:MAG: hypothetical protein ACPKM0_07595 [Pleomorphochaeta sp.]
MNKKIFSIIVVLLINFNIFCSVFENNQDLYTLETDHFNIIFDEESVNEGYIISENCEETYFQICDFFGLTRDQKFNVAITSDIDQFNAYFSIYPSPHIVLYNTIGTNNSFNYFSSNYLLNVFKHELTHALTLTGKNNFIQKIFSQSLNFSLLNVTQFNSEGFAVLSESLNGEGRLNSNLYRSRLLEAKAENNFLKFNESQGNRDVYPYDTFYLYGSFFNEYLYKTYGIEKYRKYINELHKLKLLYFDPNSCFKAAFKKSVYNVWNDFEETFNGIDIKEIEYEEFNYIPSTIFKADDEVYVYQSRNDSIREIESSKKIAKLLDNTYFASFNDDKLVLSTLKLDNLYSTSIFVIDEDNNKKEYEIEHFKNAIYYNDSIVGIYNEGQNQYIGFYKDGEIFKKISVEDDEYIQKIDVINDKLIYSSRYNKKDQLNIILNDNKRISYSFENIDTEIIDFSINENKIVLNTVNQNQLPRLSYIDLSTNKAYICNFDILGGVYNPIIIDNNVYYISNFSQEYKARKSNLTQFDFYEVAINVNENTVVGHENINYDLTSLNRYNKFDYMLDGSFFPFILPAKDFLDFDTLIYFESIDPIESLHTNLITYIGLYDNYDTSMLLQLSNVTGNKGSSLFMNYNTELVDVLNTSTLDFTYNYLKIFDLKNNNNLIFKSSISSNNFDTLIFEPTFGYYFDTSIGPKEENIFAISLKYNPLFYYERYNADIYLNNIITASVYFPYLLPFVNCDSMTLNMPFKLSYEYKINKNEYIFDISILLFKKEIQKSFEKMPLYFHNLESYVNYSTENVISLYTLFTSSVTQVGMFSFELSPGLCLNYDFENKTYSYEVDFYYAF